MTIEEILKELDSKKDKYQKEINKIGMKTSDDRNVCSFLWIEIQKIEDIKMWIRKID